MPRPDPYVPRNPNDLLRSTDWNEIQVRTREDVQNHNHTGGEQGVLIGRAAIALNAIDGARVDPASTLTVTGLTVTGTFRVGTRTLISEIDALATRVGSLETRAGNLEARATALENGKVNRTGDIISGTLKTDSLGVGLGSSNPATRLEVRGTTSDAAAAALRVSNSVNSNLLEVRNDGAIFAGTFFANIGGNVGIGTSSPSAKLHVVGGVALFSGDVKVGAGGNGTIWARHLNGKHWQNDNPDPLFLNHDTKMPVIIGTSTAYSSLEIYGPLKVYGDSLKNSAGYTIVQTNATDWLRINPDSQFPATAHYKSMAINGGGLAVGEWSVQPQGQLLVTADAHVRGSIAESGGWLRDRYAAKDHVHDTLWSSNGAYRVTMQPDRNFVAYSNSGPFWASNTAVSDGTLKRDVVPIPGAMEGLRKLRGVSFYWKDEERGTGRELGVIAQEVEAVFPELVNLLDGKHRLVRYEKFVPVLIQALKEQDARIQQLEGRLKELEPTP